MQRRYNSACAAARMAVKNPRFQRFSAQALLWTLDAALKAVPQAVS
jgi:hypothetical protein